MGETNLSDRAIRIEISIVEQGLANGGFHSRGLLCVRRILTVVHLLLVKVLIELLNLFNELFIVDYGLFPLLMYSHFVLIDRSVIV